MSVYVDGGEDWRAEAVESGDVLRVSFTCPTCGTQDRVHLQRGTRVTQLWCLRDARGVDVELTEG